MAQPVPRRRAERDAPDADSYAGRGRRDAASDDEDRRPRRGRERGELPGRRGGREPEPPERTTEGTEIPATEKDLEGVSDDDYNELLNFFDVPEGLSESDEFVALWEAVEKSREEPAGAGPSRGRRGRSEPDDEPPARGRGRSRSDEDEPPARGRGRASRDEGGDEDKPRGRGRSSRGDEPRGRGRDEDDEPPTRRTPRGGFEGYKTTRSKTYTGDFKLTPDLLLSKFLEDEPFDSYAEHALFTELKDGQRIWMCIEDDCPICNTGHKPRAVALWNIIAIPEEGEPHLEVLKAGPMLSKEIEKKAALKTGPMTKEYYALAQPDQEKNSGPIGPIVEVVRERDVKDEWKFDPFTDKELDEFFADRPDPKTYVQFPKRSELKEVARKLRDSD
jgi:hypothetical protein